MRALRRSSGRTIFPLATAIALAAVVIVLISRGTSPPPSEDSGAAPHLLGRPAPLDSDPAPSAAAAGSSPRFAHWLTFESEENRNNEHAQTAFIDALLGHRVFQSPPSGVPDHVAQALLLPDDELLLSSGRRLWNRKLEHAPGLVGRFCFIHSTYCLGDLFRTQFFIDGRPAVIYGNQYRITRYPSHTLVEYFFPEVLIEERKFITWDDRAAATYRMQSRDGRAHRVSVEVSAPYQPAPQSSGPTLYPLMGHGQFQGDDVYIYIDAPHFQRSDAAAVHLRDVIDLAADSSSAQSQIAVSFENRKRAESFPGLPDDFFEQHRNAYQQWFADYVPYFDASDPAFKKMWYYRWWVVRFNWNEFDAPDLRGTSFYEGKLGFDNVISFAVPVQLKELAYLRDGRFGVSQAANSYRNLSSIGAVVDPPGSPYWGEMYSQWIAQALAEFHRVHPMETEELRRMLPAIAGDVRAWMKHFDQDGDGLPERVAPRLTGYDLDILSFWYFHGLRLDPYAKLEALERVDFASFVFANARGTAELARTVGDASLATEMEAVAETIRAAVLAQLWDPETGFFYPQRARDDARIPIRELHGFFPFAMHLAPDEPEITRALARLIDPEEFWARFGPVITSQAHYREWTWEMDGLTRNIAPHPITMGARTTLEAAKHFPSGPIGAQHFMELMRRYNDLVYPGVHPSDPYWRPNAHEYFSKWEPGRGSPRPEASDISHDFHSAYNYLIVEGAAGLTPRSDEIIELRPLARDWDYFLLDGVRYRGRDLTIVWDAPDGRRRYEQFPEGFSLYIAGKLGFTQASLTPVRFDPASGTIETGFK